jgi:hypothetical protein
VHPVILQMVLRLPVFDFLPYRFAAEPGASLLGYLLSLDEQSKGMSGYWWTRFAGPPYVFKPQNPEFSPPVIPAHSIRSG